MKNREKIQEILSNRYIDKDVNVIFKNAIVTQMTIHNAKIIMNDNTLILTNGKEEEFIINLSFVTDTEITNNSITFEILDEQIVTLDY